MTEYIDVYADKLKPCPFCGGEADMKYEYGKYRYGWGYTPRYEPRCQNCNCNIGAFSNEQEAAEAWNRRADNG